MKFTTAHIIGSGNVAHILGKALKEAGIQILSIHSRNLNHAQELSVELGTQVTEHLQELTPSDLVILAVSDDQIAAVSRELPDSTGFVIHCSGGMPLEEIEIAGPHGVFYPFQSFTKGRNIGLKQIPVFIEVSSPEFLEPLSQLAVSLGASAYEVSSENRRKLHLSGVIANNFTNHLLQLAMEWLESQQLPKAVLYPLLFETLSKAIEMGPEKAQTGPAKRGDRLTLEKHLEMLESQPRMQELYRSFTESIQRTQESDPNSLSS